MRTRIVPPWVELGFYKQGTKSIDLLCAVAKVLGDEKVQFHEWYVGYADRMDGDTAYFTDAQSGIDWVCSHSGEIFAAVSMQSWLVPVRSGMEKLSCFDYADTPINNKIVRLVTTGEDYTTGGDPKRGQKRGIRISQKFRRLCSRLAPTYAAITVEYPLETPEQLLQDASSYAFRNFYLGFADFSPRTVKAVRALLSDAYVEEMDAGVYFSSYSAFNEAGVNAGTASGNSSKVAALLAKDLTTPGR